MLELPKSCHVGKILAKEKVLKQLTTTELVRTAFTKDLERIRVQYELIASKLNITPSETIKKIIVLELHLRRKDNEELLLKTLATAFKVPLFFITYYSDVCHYSVILENDKRKTIFSKKVQNDEPSILPLFLSMDALYSSLIELVLPLPCREEESTLQYCERNLLSVTLESDIAKLEKQMNSEKQFNKRVELNRKVTALKNDLQALRGSHIDSEG